MICRNLALFNTKIQVSNFLQSLEKMEMELRRLISMAQAISVSMLMFTGLRLLEIIIFQERLV